MKKHKRRRLRWKAILKIAGAYAAIATVLIILWAMDLDQVTWLTVLLLVMFAVFSYRIDSLEKRESLQLHEDFLKDLYASPIEPKTVTSKGIPKEGWGVSEDDQKTFQDLESFARTINSMLADLPFRLQELAETEIGDLYGPSYGRRYEVYHGRAKVGSLSLRRTRVPKEGETTHVLATADLRYARYMGCESLSSFMNLLAQFLASSPREAESQRAYILSVLLSAVWPEGRMWKNGPDKNSDPSLEFQFDGTATLYREMRPG